MPNHHNDPRITPVLPYPTEDKRPIVDRVAAWVGLGGIRERWTSGELAWWMISASFLSSGLTMLVIMAIQN